MAQAQTRELTSPNTPGSPQNRLNLRPLPNRLGYNGPYIGGLAQPVGRDCDRIEGHSDLFRELERFEPDLREAIERVWSGIVFLNVLRAKEEPDEAEVLDAATSTLELAFQSMQEAYLVAEVLDDRARDRDRQRAARDFLGLISTASREEMSGFERLAEEARLTWQISKLFERMNVINGTKRCDWKQPDQAALESLTARLDAIQSEPTAEGLQAMTNDELAAELLRLETAIASMRKCISLVLAVKRVRHG